jgi:hypothetical protein
MQHGRHAAAAADGAALSPHSSSGANQPSKLSRVCFHVQRLCSRIRALSAHTRGSDEAGVLLRRNHGCNSGSCVLCKHNPAKRCTGNFAAKYWVGDKLLAKCEGGIAVELIDADSGERCDDLAGMRIEARDLPKWAPPK